MRWLLAILLGAGALPGATLADLASGIRELALDPDECYRVRDLSLAREDIRLFFTDGYLIFSQPVAGRRIAAVFTTDVQGGEGEILLLPPTRGERRSLAAYTGSPNMSERIRTAVLLFTDDSYEVLTAGMSGPFNRKVPEMGLLAAEEWNPLVRNLASSYQTRLALDILDPGSSLAGFFAAVLTGVKLGNFDVLANPRALEQVLAGQLTVRGGRAFFDVWTSFPARSWRSGERESALEFTLRDYRIEATVEPDLNLSVTSRVRLRPRETTRVLPFEIARSMRIESAAINGLPAEVLQREALRANLVRGAANDLFLVAPPEPLDPAREYEIEFRHQGRVIHDAGNQVYYVGARANWYPTWRMQFVSYDLAFRHAKNFDIVLPGELVEQRSEDDWRVTRRRTNRPVRFAGFNLGHYDVARETRGGYTVEVYANQTFEEALQARPRQPLVVIQPPPVWNGRRPRRPEPVVVMPEPPPPAGPRVRLEELASEVASALEFMAQRFGPPALETLAVSPVPGAFGQGFPGLLYLSTLAYLNPSDYALTRLTPRHQTFFTDLLQAHETAHQWWGNIVTGAGAHDDWLMEALANYSALLYLEKRRGRRAMEGMLEEYRTALLANLESGEPVDSAGPIVLGDRLESSQAPHAWRAIIYGKGSWILHMLRCRMGDARFLEMLAELRRRHEWKTVSTVQFRELAARFMPPKSPDAALEYFFDQWIYGTGIPALKMTHTTKGKGSAMRVVGTIAQSEVDPVFSVAVPVEVQFARGKSITHIVETGPDPVEFTVPVAQPPTRVVLDPSRTVLRR